MLFEYRVPNGVGSARAPAKGIPPGRGVTNDTITDRRELLTAPNHCEIKARLRGPRNSGHFGFVHVPGREDDSDNRKGGNAPMARTRFRLVSFIIQQFRHACSLSGSNDIEAPYRRRIYLPCSYECPHG